MQKTTFPKNGNQLNVLTKILITTKLHHAYRSRCRILTKLSGVTMPVIYVPSLIKRSKD